MKKAKYLKNEARRVLQQYRTAIAAEGKGTAIGTIRSAFRIMEARLLHGIGPVHYSLYRLSDVPRERWKSYITDGPEFKQFLKSLNPEHLRDIGKNKLKFYQHCVENGLPTIPVICVVATNPGPTVEGVEWVCTLDHWRTVIQDAPSELFIKPIDGTYGEGAFVVSKDGTAVEFDGRSGSVDDLFAHLKSRLVHERGWLVQPRMRSHPSLDGIISPHGLATVRAITHMCKGKAELLIADLKITVGNNVVDNFSKGKSGNLLAGISVETGFLGTAWGSARRDWPEMARYPHHPETTKLIEGHRLPFWSELTQLALKAQESLPQLLTLGWDIAATRDGVMLVETNTTYDVSILQIAHQRGLKYELLSALTQKE